MIEAGEQSGALWVHQSLRLSDPNSWIPLPPDRERVNSVQFKRLWLKSAANSYQRRHLTTPFNAGVQCTLSVKLVCDDVKLVLRRSAEFQSFKQTLVETHFNCIPNK